MFLSIAEARRRALIPAQRLLRLRRESGSWQAPRKTLDSGVLWVAIGKAWALFAARGRSIRVRLVEAVNERPGLEAHP